VVRTPDEKARQQQRQDEIRELAELMREYDLTELTIEEGKELRKIHLQRGGPVGQVAVSTTPLHLPPAEETMRLVAGVSNADAALEEIAAPMPGTFYASPRPGEPSFVAVGDRVEKGQILCIIEAMKLMNQIEAEFVAEIVEVIVDNGAPVGFGQPLFRVRRL
jgi:acetyl-CoA carboxylase biotin carboxyl carrier protein